MNNNTLQKDESELIRRYNVAKREAEQHGKVVVLMVQIDPTLNSTILWIGHPFGAVLPNGIK